MNYKQLTGTDLLVSDLCLGTVQFGSAIGERRCFEQLDEFTDLGGNFLDTAHVYGDWLPGDRARSERVIGKWLKQSGKRNNYVISTKGAHPKLDSMEVSRVSREAIITDIEESLKCLGADTIDLYFLHRDNESVSVCEILDILEAARKKGYFSKLLKGDTIPENVAAIYENEANYKIAEELKALKACGITPVQACISYFNEQPFTAIPLASFRSIEQMKETVAGCDVTLSMEVRKRINNIKTFVSDL